MLNTHIKSAIRKHGVSWMGTAFLMITKNLEAKEKLEKFDHKIKKFMRAQHIINRKQMKNWGRECVQRRITKH